MDAPAPPLAPMTATVTAARRLPSIVSASRPINGGLRVGYHDDMLGPQRDRVAPELGRLRSVRHHTDIGSARQGKGRDVGGAVGSHQDACRLQPVPLRQPGLIDHVGCHGRSGAQP